MFGFSEANLEEARRYLYTHRGARDIPAGLIRSDIRESWRRCLRAGLEPTASAPIPSVPSPELSGWYQAHPQLLEIARREVRNLYSQLAGSNCAVAFASPDATILEAMADPVFRRMTKAEGIGPGFNWRENLLGTNALGCVATTAKPAVVRASEHFLDDCCDLTCIAVPVLSEQSALLGIVDASSGRASDPLRTTALVRRTALRIEADLFRQEYREYLVLRFHPQQQRLHSPDAGLLAVGPQGLLTAANRQARFLLRHLALEPGTSFTAIFSPPYEQLLSQLAVASSCAVADHRGNIYYVAAENLLRTPIAPPTSDRVAREPVPPPVASPSGFVAEDSAVQGVLRLIDQAVAWSVPILIRGETGTGKELLARYIHSGSGRTGQFVAINCTALPETLVESEFFGYRDGAFTGARRGGARGLVLEADKGTLFLDEIGDMPFALQGRLLRLLDQWTVRAIGSAAEEKVDVQLVAATNSDLESAVQQRRFRSDLLYRLRGLEIALPALRDRSDFGAIVHWLLRSIRPDLSISDPAMELLQQYPWPGNIRQLKHTLLRMAIAAHATLLRPSDVLSAMGGPPRPAGSNLGTLADPATLQQSYSDHIWQTYCRCQYNVMRTARELSVSRNTVYRELRRRGIVGKQSDNGEMGEQPGLS